MTTTIDPELLRPILFNPRYAASADGEIWSSYSGVWKRLRPARSRRNRHLTVSLSSPDRPGKFKSFYVHRLVIEAWLGPIPEGMVVCHRDDDAGRNHLENLYVGTQVQNAEDARRNGRLVLGEKATWTRLIDAQVRDIVVLSGQGWSQSRIADHIGCGQAHVSAILLGRLRREATGLSPVPKGGTRGEGNGNARLTDEAVREVVSLSRSGLTQRDIARKLGCSQGNISMILRGETRSEVTGFPRRQRPPRVRREKEASS